MLKALLDETLREILVPAGSPNPVLDEVHKLRMEIRQMSESLSNKIETLKADIAAQTSEVASVKTFVAGLSTQLSTAIAAAKAAGATDDQLQELTDLDGAVKANTADLASAVVANTPSATDTTTASADTSAADTTTAAGTTTAA